MDDRTLCNDNSIGISLTRVDGERRFSPGSKNPAPAHSSVIVICSKKLQSTEIRRMSRQIIITENVVDEQISDSRVVRHDDNAHEVTRVCPPREGRNCGRVNMHPAGTSRRDRAVVLFPASPRNKGSRGGARGVRPTGRRADANGGDQVAGAASVCRRTTRTKRDDKMRSSHGPAGDDDHVCVASHRPVVTVLSPPPPIPPTPAGSLITRYGSEPVKRRVGQTRRSPATSNNTK